MLPYVIPHSPHCRRGGSHIHPHGLLLYFHIFVGRYCPRLQTLL